MDQMNVSITDHLAGYVRARVKSGRYNNASEVVREALRRMEEADERALRIAAPTVEDVLTDFTANQIEAIRILGKSRALDRLLRRARRQRGFADPHLVHCAAGRCRSKLSMQPGTCESHSPQSWPPAARCWAGSGVDPGRGAVGQGSGNRE